MAGVSSDVYILAGGVFAASLWLFRGSIFPASSSKPTTTTVFKHGDIDLEPRNFVQKMKKGNKRIVIFYGSQTGTAEEYAIRIAKEAKSRFGLGSLVCDPEEYDFDNLDQIPEDCCAIFVMATYGEGEPTDNAVELYKNLTDDSYAFSNGEHKLDGLKYVVFGLGNRTYEHYNAIARKTNEALAKAGAKIIGSCGEGDDDKSLEEDYLEWKEEMWPAFSEAMGVEEGVGSDTPDFKVTEVSSHAPEKVYLGELSARALTKVRGIHDAKNPYASPIVAVRELFTVGADRNCVHMELNLEGSGITYQHGDHLGVWCSNPDVEVERMLAVLGLLEKRTQVIGIESLDPALAKVPFPAPTTYETVLRHYIDISAVVGRQILGIMAKYAPTPDAELRLRQLSTDKEEYHKVVTEGCLRLSEVLQLAAGNNYGVPATSANTTVWPIPFDLIVSSIPRLQPRYYSISSSPKMHPGIVHITAVVLKYQTEAAPKRWIYGVGTNFILNLKYATHKELPDAPLVSEGGSLEPASVSLPSYSIVGPRGSHQHDTGYKIPVHVRRSTFRLPTNPKSPVIMVGPGTGVAPFRGFVQERVALAKRTLEKNGPEGLAQWGRMTLFYGCRKPGEDYLYENEWPAYQQVLGDKFSLQVAFSRSAAHRKPDGSKMYVQDLVWQDRQRIADEILVQKAYVYICGDAKNMSKSVEDTLTRILAEAKGGDEAEGAKELKLLKDRSRLMLDVWS
ncbi:cytochrome P450 oxidoreductase [Auriculariales sp. MPI-PUGE-AT-0066]|nr:cytochrome P450 oxidoreductase [Auriculariales sp. MPI-PUGE-AT-0066]